MSEPAAATGASWWTLRLAERPGLSPLRVSLAIGGVLSAVYLVAEAALGRLALVASEANALSDFRLGFSLIALVAYLPGALAHVALSAQRTSQELGLGAQARAALPAAHFRAIGIAGMLFFLAIPLVTHYDDISWDLSRLPPEAIWHRLMLAPMGWFMARFNAWLWAESRRLSRIGGDDARIDLLDLAPLDPLARAGLRHALLYAGLFSFLLFALLDQRVAPGLPLVLAVLGSFNVVGALAALVAPMWGAHQGIVAAKTRERVRCDADLRFLRAQAVPSAGALADVAAWRALIDSAPDWPIDAPSLRRFLLYLALPLGSWLGGAFVDLVVERLVR